ncbi:type IV pilin-like G/H family protein [Pseudanabaena sp. PCC 6802]|uniref:type IV pilin-like G/H family protein n=1 Tax=Pseudanabaena sp. PCC 6802 TaxID=118173 RepID=UPI0003480581|nr:type IV pilin-like G/H family protein [Pseudanabaena sp. PCC 6802]
MTHPQSNPRRGLWQWAFIVSGSSLLAALAGFGLWGSILRSPGNTVAYSNELTNPSSKKLLGTWQGNGRNIIFTPEGEMLIQHKTGVAIPFKYQLQKQNDNYIDLSLYGETQLGIFELTNDGKLRLAISGPGEPRPTSFNRENFSISLFSLERVSDRTTLSPDSRLSEQEVNLIRSQARQSEARSYTSSLNKGQQAFFVEKNRFSSSIDDLGVGIKSETNNYSYRVRVFDNKRVQTMGIAKKDGLRSYTGAVFVLRERNTSDVTSVDILCESDRLTKAIPPIPTASSEYTDAKLNCPVGYTAPKQSPSAVTSVSILNRGQQAFFLEKNRFSSSIEDLEIHINTETDDYSYKVRLSDNKRVQTMGIAKKNGLRSYTGAVFVLKIRNTQDIGTISILCESDRPTKAIPPIPTASSEYTDALLNCPVGYTDLRQSPSAMNSVSMLNRGQQVFFLGKNRFSSSIEDLQLDIKSETYDYSYRVRVLDNKRVQTMGIAKKDGLRSYTGAVFVLKSRNISDVISVTILCESNRPTKAIPPTPTASSEYTDARLKCPPGYTQVDR